MIPLMGITMQFRLIYYMSLITIFITIQLYLTPDLKHIFLWAPHYILVVTFRCNTNPGLPEADGVTEAAGSKHTDPPQQVHLTSLGHRRDGNNTISSDMGGCGDDHSK